MTVAKQILELLHNYKYTSANSPDRTAKYPKSRADPKFIETIAGLKHFAGLTYGSAKRSVYTEEYAYHKLNIFEKCLFL